MQMIKHAAAVQLCYVNGSAKSIIKWGCKCNLDNHHQIHAFEMIMASFVLTYFKDAAKSNEEMTTCDNQSRTKFVRERKLFCQLSELSNDTEQLICCLHGPAGSGNRTGIALCTRALFVPTQCYVLSQYYCGYCHDWCHGYFNMWRINAWYLVFKLKTQNRTRTD